MNIQDLLNPVRRASNAVPRPGNQNSAAQKRQKVAKDAPIYSETSKTTGFINYPPYETNEDKQLAAQHLKFRISPLGEIRKTSARHIPYNSEKKDFLEKTGRDAFEVFQYTYKIPGEEKTYVVLWDYNVGLVRITPFFKSCKYAKTVPAKAMKENPGLLDVCYSITGGALICQGYWMPFQAARALASNFCYGIRWALTPIFGPDFPSTCLSPKDPQYGKFIIDPAVVQQVTQETARFRMEGKTYQLQDTTYSKTGLDSPFQTPKIAFGNSPWTRKTLRNRRPGTADLESGYGTDTDTSEKYLFSPQISPRSQTWASANKSQSPTPMSPSSLASSAFSSPKSAAFPFRVPVPTSVPGGYYNGGPHSQEEIDAAQIIISFSRGDSALPPLKRLRRDIED